jgi:hypothetical protein
VVRSMACGALGFAVGFVFTHHPFPFGPDYVSAGLIGAGAGALTALWLTFRAYLCVQRILAERAGCTLWYWMGQKVRAKLPRRA